MSRSRRSRRSRSASAASSGPPDEVVVTVSDPTELVASLGALLGFVPAESAVIIGLRHHAGRQRVHGLARVDLPAPDDVDAARTLADAVHGMIPTPPDEVVLAIVAEGPATTGGPWTRPPHGVFVDALTDAFARTRIPVTGASWVPRIAPGAPWRCYERCDCTGTLPDPAATVAAATTASMGQVTYASRDEAMSVLAPEPAASSGRRRALLDAALEAAVLDRELDRRGAVRRDLAAVRHAAGEVGRGRALGDAEAARLAAALCDPAVRDVCLGFAFGHDPAVAGDEVRRLWTALARGVPDPEAAEPAVLLACAALADGDSGQVRSALARAQRADPSHRLSRLVAQMLVSGLDGDAARDWLDASVAEATAALAA